MPDRYQLKQPLVFYDIETTGTNIDFDQILQFAAVLTTPDFKEIERFEVRCQRLPWVVPSPGAMLVTGMSPSQLNDATLPLFPEMMKIIRDTLRRWSPAVFLGYNSIRFDEPFLQRALWQNLYPPYLTIRDGNGRADVLPLVRAVSRIAAHAFKIPNMASGRPSYRLDRLAPLNGFAHKHAHDALGDVEATIHIAKRIASRVPKAWYAAIERSDQDYVIQVLQSSRPVLVMEPDADGKPGWWGFVLGQLDSQKSSQVLARLDRNWEMFFSLNGQDQRKFLSNSPAPVRQIRTNHAPLVFGGAEAKELFGIGPSKEELAAANAFLTLPGRKQSLAQLYESTRPTWPEASELEQKIFESLPSKEDEQLMFEFNSVPWAERNAFIRQFTDGRFQQIAQRLIYLMAPGTLTDAERERVQGGIRDRLLSEHDDMSLWRTVRMAKEELKQLTKSTADRTKTDEISNWLDNLATSVS